MTKGSGLALQRELAIGEGGSIRPHSANMRDSPVGNKGPEAPCLRKSYFHASGETD